VPSGGKRAVTTIWGEENREGEGKKGKKEKDLPSMRKGGEPSMLKKEDDLREEGARLARREGKEGGRSVRLRRLKNEGGNRLSARKGRKGNPESSQKREGGRRPLPPAPDKRKKRGRKEDRCLIR